MLLTKKRTSFRLLTCIITFVILVSVIIGSTLQVFAANTTQVVGGDGITYSVIWNDSNGDGKYDATSGDYIISVTNIANGSTDNNLISIVQGPLSNATGSNTHGTGETAGGVTSNAKETSDAIDQITDTLNVKADLAAATRTLSDITDMVNTIIGLLASAILILIGIFTAIDVLYLEVPPLHNHMDNGAMQNGQTNKSGNVKPKIVSEDASNAYSEAAKDGKNPLIIYLKKRIVAYIAVAIVLYMLLSGNLALIVKVILKSLNGVFNWFEDFSDKI